MDNTSAQPEAVAAWVAADRRLDLDTMQAQLAEDVVLVSPLTDGFSFHGPHDVAQVFASAFDLLTDIRIHKVTRAGAPGSARHGSVPQGLMRETYSARAELSAGP